MTYKEDIELICNHPVAFAKELKKALERHSIKEGEKING